MFGITKFTSVVSICPIGRKGLTFDGIPLEIALRKLQEQGADVVTLNCSRGPKTMIPLMEKCCEEVKGAIGCLPVCYRTDEQHPNFQSFKFIGTDQSCYPHDLVEHAMSYEQVTWYADKCKELGLDYVGLCCGNDPSYMRTLAQSFGRVTALDRYKNDRGKNAVLRKYMGSDDKVNRYSGLAAFALNE